MYQEMSTSVKKELILTGQEMVEIHNYKSVFKLHLSFMIHHKLMYAQQVKFSCQHYQNWKVTRFTHIYTISLLSNPQAKVTPTICCCTLTMHKEVKSHSLTHTKSWASSNCRQVARHFVHTSELSCSSMVKASLGMLKVLNLKAYHEMMASSLIIGLYTNMAIISDGSWDSLNAGWGYDSYMINEKA